MALSPSQISWIAIAVQLGFVAGTLISATLNLPDIISTRHLFAVSAFLGAARKCAFGLYVHDPATAIVLRFLTGVCLAGVYPPGMKIMATWFRERRGMALGVLVGALTMGKATPYLVNALGSANWRSTCSSFRCSRQSAGSSCSSSSRMVHMHCRRRSLTCRRLCACSAIAACDSRALVTSVTCGNSTPCGSGSR